MRKSIVLVEPMMAEIEARLDERYDVFRVAGGRDGDIPADNRFEAVVTGGGSGLPPAWFDRLPHLKVVAINGVGTDAVDLKAARDRNVDVTTTPGVLAGDVADLALAMILAFLRKVPEGHSLVRSGAWQGGEKPVLGRSPRGKRIGILGLGEIGRETAVRATAFGMSVSYYNRSDVDVPADWQRAADPVALATQCDIVVVSLAANASTENMIGEEFLNALGPQGILVNVARGALVDEDALIEALTSGRIAGACLDVYRDEPGIRDAFRTLPNVLLMPHQGSATRETRLAMGTIVLESLRSVFAGERPAASVFKDDAALLPRRIRS
ncbi:2-hydroxyacid dehydrogenase [Jiella sp. KSK16Y-1]|uniref:2-hydroxyacid dehydrogenase n=2 Tax=Jiella mangrovi TaxID=2821407 RepID=A0ABS4BJB5_9HYPH|nr:2-hydroxyacid dehydrogenase [Jiella mangrovi]